IWSAMRRATGSAPRLSARTSRRAGPACASGAHAAANAARAAGHGAQGRGSAQREHTPAPSHGSVPAQSEHRRSPEAGGGAPHAAHAGGATRRESTATGRRSTRGSLPRTGARLHRAIATILRRRARGSTALLRQSRAVPADYSWTFDPGPIIVIAIAVILYVPRWRKVRRTVGPPGASGWRMLSFVAGFLTVAPALLSPIDRLGEQAFVMHMAQHLLLLDVAPILLICSMTKAILRPATRRLQSFERSIGPLADPLFAIAFYVAVMWVWHAPAMYDA